MVEYCLMKKTVVLTVAFGFVATALAGTWTKYGENPVLGGPELGTCFDVNVVTDGPAPYTMYFSWRTKDAIALVRSDDAFHWTQEPEICLEKNPASGWEMKLNRSCTVKKDGIWHMWYTGQYRRPGEAWASKMGYATSKDGVRFTRVQADPVMVPERDFEKNSVMNPYVRWDAKRALWRMWYAAGDTYEPNVLCCAESKDGVKWEKSPLNPIFGHGAPCTWDRDRVGACEVHPLPDGRWAMFYIGYSDVDTARIGCAVSADGVTGWRRLDANPLVSPDICTWDSSACYKPSVLRDEKNNRWLLWYNGRNGIPEYVGMAIHEGLDLEAPNPKFAVDTTALLKEYVARFNRKDVEHYTNAISNAEAEDFMLKNCPRFACPDKDIERTYYFRWWTFRKHLKKGEKGGWRVTEFLPKVSWSGTDNTIVCPAGHHLREARWLRDGVCASDLARFWLADPQAGHRWKYSSWLYTATCLAAEVIGDDRLPESLLDAAVSYYSHWEEGVDRGAWPEKGQAHMGGDGKGGFTSIDNYEGTELSLGGNGYKPLMASAMWSEAKTIAEVAKTCGRTDLARTFAEKAEVARRSMITHCWNPDLGFFTTAKTNGTKGVVRELHGYAPWYFGMPTDACRPDWSQLSDPQGFAARYGLTFPERRAPGFTIDYAGHECKWNGPSWPFATSIALTALMNDLHSTPAPNTYTSLFASLLWQYADAQRLTHPRPREGGDWEVVPWIDENLNPDKAEWLSRKIILDTPKMLASFPKERGKDYNHSTFCDLVISGLVGFVPDGKGGFAVDPLFPETWDYLVLENLRYRGHDVDIRWRRGKGLSACVDGRETAHCETLGRLGVGGLD